MTAPDLLCFSHLRWAFVFQRPNHLMSRFARQQRVFFIEEPVFDAHTAHLETEAVLPNLLRVVPHVPPCGLAEAEAATHALLRGLCRSHSISQAIHWFYTPMMLGMAGDLPRSLTVYDCMDELANFLHAPPELVARERRLLREADVVFTGGRSLYESKRKQHRNVHAIPSSVDVAHFERARLPLAEPPDQARWPHPRIGYCGVIDERIDLALLEAVAHARPAWQLVMLGPVVKIDPGKLPKAPNIHYPGLKTYAELPQYLSGWDAAIMPFARNEATRFISPTKTPEYLAAGKPVVSTSIQDVVEPYGRLGLVRIADDPQSFIAELSAALSGGDADWAARRDAFLAGMSWDATWQQMQQLLRQAEAAQADGREGPIHLSSSHV